MQISLYKYRSLISAAHMDLFLSDGRGHWLFLFQFELFLALQVNCVAFFRDRVSFSELTESDKRSMILQKLRIPVCLNILFRAPLVLYCQYTSKLC